MADVLVIIGAGGMGEAIARRTGSGHRVLLSDFNEDVAHTAGLSPVQAPPPAIPRVNLVGVAYSMEEFGQVVAPGGSGVVISSHQQRENLVRVHWSTLTRPRVHRAPLTESTTCPGPRVAKGGPAIRG